METEKSEVCLLQKVEDYLAKRIEPLLPESKLALVFLGFVGALFALSGAVALASVVWMQSSNEELPSIEMPESAPGNATPEQFMIDIGKYGIKEQDSGLIQIPCEDKQFFRFMSDDEEVSYESCILSGGTQGRIIARARTDEGYVPSEEYVFSMEDAGLISGNNPECIYFIDKSSEHAQACVEETYGIALGVITGVIERERAKSFKDPQKR